MNKQQIPVILEKIKQYDKIVLFRHVRPDGDAAGSVRGLRRILQLTYPDKDIRLLSTDRSDAVAFLGEEDAPCPDAFFADALGIVLDTATPERIANEQYQKCREIIKIDHHIGVAPYGDVMWVEEGASSTCEMIVALWDALRDEWKMDCEAASYLYTGMVTDSGRFRFDSVTGDTLRYAAMLLDMGIETEMMYANLYMKDVAEYKFQSYVYDHMSITPSGVAYLYIDRAMKARFGLTDEQAGEAVNHMSEIKGSLVWLVFLEADDGTTRVRLRSRFVAINELAAKYHGGGHAHACGAKVENREEADALVADADALLADYKKTHTDWL